MRPPAFLDTGAIYALADRNDADHVAVRSVYFDSQRLFLTHELILVEAFSLVTKRLNKAAAIKIVGALRSSSRVEVIPIADLLQAAWTRCERFADKEWDWIDCTSFELIERRRIREALSLDHHFEQAGFVMLVQ